MQNRILRRDTNRFSERTHKPKYKKKIELFSTTRSDTSEFNATVYRELIEYAIELSKRYNIAETLRSSGYYKNADGIPEDLDFYEALRFIETNSTPEFYTLASEIIYEGKTISNDLIINNTNLLPNEQISLLVANKITESFPDDVQSRATAADCRAAYDTKMKTCNRWLIGSTIGTIAAAVASFGTLATVAGAATAIDYARCQGDATTIYMTCMEKIIDKK